MASLREGAAAHPPVEDKAEGALTALAAGALGVGAAVASDNTARYRGVQPADLVAPLQAEFNGRGSAISFSGRPEALTGTVELLSASGAVPALTINLTAAADGTEVKVNDLTTRGLLETVKEGGRKLLGAAGAGLDLLRGGTRSPGEAFERASQALSQGADLAETAGNLKLKERAWKAIKQAAENIETGYQARLEQERLARTALEQAWDRHTSCPTCGVAFGDGDQECRVCGTARPEAPARPDPRRG